ncbi:MAG: pyridoxal-phosphate dependent enzyme [Bacteroidetes bacterium]|nr:pyridoxal-phosphate dependent enzyme [Bacteroidota bacterium]
MSSEFDNLHAPLQPLKVKGIKGDVYIQRDDLIHPLVSGNKWRKLQYHILYAQQEDKTRLVTFGGAYSNHLLATAAAGAILGLQTTAFLRADEPIDNHYLRAARLYGMQLIPVSREQYRHKQELFTRYFDEEPNAYCIAEGGAGEAAWEGVAGIVKGLPFAPNYILHASATATTAIGLGKGIQACGYKTLVYAVAVLNNAGEQRQLIQEVGLSEIVEVLDGFAFGGYAKTTEPLMDFVKNTIAQTGILFDPVYTGKALWALRDLALPGTGVFLHTGGSMGLFSEAFLKQM